MDCSLPGSSAHGIFQARVLEWGAIAFSDTVARRILLKHNTLGHFSAQNLPRVSVTLIMKVSLCHDSQRSTQSDPSCLVNLLQGSTFTALKSKGLYLLKIVFTCYCYSWTFSIPSLSEMFPTASMKINQPCPPPHRMPVLFHFFLLHFSLPSIPHLFTIIFCFCLSSSLEYELHMSFCSLLYAHGLEKKIVHYRNTCLNQKYVQSMALFTENKKDFLPLTKVVFSEFLFAVNHSYVLNAFHELNKVVYILSLTKS